MQCCIIPAHHTVSMLRSWAWPTLFPKRNATFHSAFLLRPSVGQAQERSILTVWCAGIMQHCTVNAESSYKNIPLPVYPWHGRKHEHEINMHNADTVLDKAPGQEAFCTVMSFPCGHCECPFEVANCKDAQLAKILAVTQEATRKIMIMDITKKLVWKILITFLT